MPAKPTKHAAPVVQTAKPQKRKASTSFTLQGEKAAIQDLLAQGEDGHFLIGQHYLNVVDNNLAQQAGYATAVQFFAKELKEIPQATLTRYGAVARAFTEPVVKQYGCTKLAELLAYQNAAHLPASAGDPGSILIKVPQKKGGGTADKAFKDCSAGDLAAALKALKGPVALPGDAGKKVAKLQAALDQALGQGKVHAVAHLRGHQVVVQLSAFDLSLASTVGDALKSA